VAMEERKDYHTYIPSYSYSSKTAVTNNDWMKKENCGRNYQEE
jgi:hypothetical protein